MKISPQAALNKLGELGEFGFSREEVQAALPTDPAQREEVLRAVALMSRPNLEHLAIDLWGSFEVTHPDYKRPALEVYAQAGPLLQKTIRALGGLNEAGEPL